MDASQIRAAIAALQAMLNEVEPAGAVYPRLEVVDGVNMMLVAPLNPLFQPSMIAHIFGSQPGTQVGDPSNAADPQYASLHLAARSAAGFPLYYAIGGDNAGRLMVIGTPSVCTHDHSFNSDAEALAYIKRITLTPDQIAAEKAKWWAWGEGLKPRQG